MLLFTPITKIRIRNKDQYSYKLTLRNEENHFFDGVPIIEYMNNKFRQGDYEDVLNLIDLYDAAQSDTANYMTDLNDAYLVIQGNVDLDVETAEKMKEARLILLQTEPGVEGEVKLTRSTFTNNMTYREQRHIRIDLLRIFINSRIHLI